MPELPKIPIRRKRRIVRRAPRSKGKVAQKTKPEAPAEAKAPAPAPAPKPAPKPQPPAAPFNPRLFVDPWYGIAYEADFALSKRHIEGECFRRDWCDQGGLGAYQHFRNYTAMLWPDTIWNPWLEEQIRSLTEPEHEHKIGKTRMRFVSWTGAGGAGKTFSAGFYACAWWSVAPWESSVTLTSTSKTILGQRVWPVIQHFHATAKGDGGQRINWGHLVNSRKMVQWQKGDEKHSIAAVAVEPGELEKSIDKIKGRHTARMMLIIDEANTTPEAIFNCIANMAKGCKELVIVVIGNAVSQLDNHGRCCEPEAGWNSITIDDERWRTKGVPQWSMLPGICCHFDGEKSPNVRLGVTKWPFIYTYENHIAALRIGRESSTYWSQERGFWPPEGITNTIFSAALIERHDGKGKHIFYRSAKPCAFMDTAFGGDKCVIVFGLLGDLEDGRLALQITERLVVQISVLSKFEIDHQVAHAYISACQERGVIPAYAGLDATGTGRGVAAIVLAEWSDQVHYVEWGGSASDKPASEEDPRPSKEVYVNRVAELWYSCRELLITEQLKGLYQEAIIDLTVREFLLRGRRIGLETKEDLRARLHRSPDDGDAIAGLCEIARRHGATPKRKDLALTLYKEDEEDEPYSQDFTFEVLDPGVNALEDATM